MSCGVKVNAVPLWLKFTFAVPAPPLTEAASSVPGAPPLPRLSVPPEPASCARVTMPVPPFTETLPPSAIVRLLPMPYWPMTRSLAPSKTPVGIGLPQPQAERSTPLSSNCEPVPLTSTALFPPKPGVPLMP